MSKEEGRDYLEMRLESDVQKLGLGLVSIGNHCKLSSCMTWLDLRLKKRNGGRKGERSAVTAWRLELKRVIANERVQLRGQCQAFPSEITEGWRRGGICEERFEY